MKNSEYWEKRIANDTWKTYNSLEEKNKALLEMYQEASLNISEELYKVAEKVKTSTPMLSDMHKYNRLTGLQKNIENIIKDLGENVENFGKDNMFQGFKNTYSNVMTQLGITEFDKVPKKIMEDMIDRPWFGSNFSTRLWKNTQVLASNLNDILTTGIIQGKTVTEMAIQLNNRMNEGFNISHRLIRTETMHYLNESAFKGYKDAGCEEVELWAAEDERTCEVCGAKHGKHYKIKDRPILPLHANCRCTYLPIIDGLKDKNSDIINEIDYEEATNIIQAEEWAINSLRMNKASYKGIELEVANYINKSISDIYSRYPILKGFVQEIKADGRASAPASAMLGFKDGKLNTKLILSKKDLSDLNSINDMIERCVNDKWWSPKDSIKGIVMHEMGHMIEYATTLKKYGVIDNNGALIDTSKLNLAFDKIRYGELSSEVRLRALSNLNLSNTRKSVKENLSDYANSSTLEFLAEAVSEDNPRALAKEAVKILNEKIKEVWE